MANIIIGIFFALTAGFLSAFERIFNAQMGKIAGEEQAYLLNLCSLTIISVAVYLIIKKNIVFADPFSDGTDYLILIGAPICIFRFFQSIKLVKKTSAAFVSVFFSIGSVLCTALIDIVSYGTVKPTFIIGCIIVMVGAVLFSQEENKNENN